MGGRILLAVVGMAMGLVLTEAASRVLEHFVCHNVYSGTMIRSREYGWGHRPGAAGWQQFCGDRAVEWRTWVRINGAGLREREVPETRRGGFRVLAIGDSFVEGYQVPDERTFTRQLEDRLAATTPVQPVEVLNAGVAGWGTDNELLFFRSEGWRYRPDLVLLVFDTTNDVLENQRRLVARSSFWPDKPYFALTPAGFALQHFPLPARSPVMERVSRTAGQLLLHSALVRWTAAVPAVWRFTVLPPPNPLEPGTAEPMEVYLRRYPPVWREAWRITRRLLLQFRRDVEARGGRFAVVVIHAREEVSPARLATASRLRPTLNGLPLDAEKPRRLVMRFLARRRIPAVDTLDAFRAKLAADGTTGYFAVDPHWTDAGHTLAARVTDEGLRRLGLVPTSAPASAP